MYDLLENNGSEYGYSLYGSNGDQVIDVYVTGQTNGDVRDTIEADMQAKISELGPSNVSLHCSDTHDVFDVAPSSISDEDAFREALDAALTSGDIDRYIPPPEDPAYHIEIEQ